MENGIIEIYIYIYRTHNKENYLCTTDAPEIESQMYYLENRKKKGGKIMINFSILQWMLRYQCLKAYDCDNHTEPHNPRKDAQAFGDLVVW